jgi:2-hydroxy-6-oxonona-2,4-dienedioate hydrolase
MPGSKVENGHLNVGHARLYYEVAGAGPPMVMIHAGVADCRQWNNEFLHFSGRFRVVRYDQRGYGRSEPAEGDFSHMADLMALLDHLAIDQPLVLIGCSMGGGLAMDFALGHPARARALIMVDSGPSGLKMDTPQPAKFAEAEKAYKAGDLDAVAELETQIWFDGMGRTADQVDQVARKLAYEMNRLALEHKARGLGKRLPNTDLAAVDQLDRLDIPVLVIVGEHDTPYMLAAADTMIEYLPSAAKRLIRDAADLCNMDQPGNPVHRRWLFRQPAAPALDGSWHAPSPRTGAR